MALGCNRNKLVDCFHLCTVSCMVCMCVCACGNWCVSDLSLRKLVTGTTANEEIWDDVDKYCCVGFHVKLDTVCSIFQCFSSELISNQVAVLDSTVLWMNATWFMVRVLSKRTELTGGFCCSATGSRSRPGGRQGIM